MTQMVGRLPLLVALAGAACGDIGVLALDVQFPNEDAEARTRALRVVVREPPPNGARGCASLWTDPPAGLRQSEGTVRFPNRNDALAAPVSIAYDILTVLVYAHPGVITEMRENPSTGEMQPRLRVTGDPLVGGCVDVPIEDSTVTTAVSVPLFPAP